MNPKYFDLHQRIIITIYRYKFFFLRITTHFCLIIYFDILERMKLFRIATCIFCYITVLQSRELDITLITKMYYCEIQRWFQRVASMRKYFPCFKRLKSTKWSCSSIFTSRFPSIPFRRHPWRAPPSPRRADAIRAHHHRLPRQG